MHVYAAFVHRHSRIFYAISLRHLDSNTKYMKINFNNESQKRNENLPITISKADSGIWPEAM